MLFVLNVTKIGHDYYSITNNYVDSSLKKYLDSYVNEAEIRNFKLEKDRIMLIFGNIVDDGVVGYCEDRSSVSHIVIDVSFFNSASEEEREMLLFHELAHCLSGRDHCDVEENDEPVSIMHSSEYPVETYKKERKKVIDELFKKDERCK
jgi:hypothetical protein